MLFAPDTPSRCWRVTQTGELAEAMADSVNSDKLTMVEVMLPKMDIPDFLRAVTRALEKSQQPRLIAAAFGNHQRLPGQQ